jgi:hypothetical protein
MEGRCASVDESMVKQQADQIRGMGGLSWSMVPIAPGTKQTYKYESALTPCAHARA